MISGIIYIVVMVILLLALVIWFLFTWPGTLEGALTDGEFDRSLLFESIGLIYSIVRVVRADRINHPTFYMISIIGTVIFSALVIARVKPTIRMIRITRSNKQWYAWQDLEEKIEKNGFKFSEEASKSFTNALYNFERKLFERKAYRLIKANQKMLDEYALLKKRGIANEAHREHVCQSLSMLEKFAIGYERVKLQEAEADFQECVEKAQSLAK